MSAYCSRDQARDAGATGSEAEIDAAIAAASSRVTRFTRELFEPTVTTLVRPIGANGFVLTHMRIIGVTAVRYLGVATPIVVDSYRVQSSTVLGQVDAIILAGTLSWSDMTVLGAEPWNGGWANLLRGVDDEPQVEIDGTFGYATAPEDVAEATAIVAAQLRGRDKTPEGSGSSTSPTDVEGNVIPVVPPFVDAGENSDVQTLQRSRTRTTGSKRADELLAPYVREPVRIRA